MYGDINLASSRNKKTSKKALAVRFKRISYFSLFIVLFSTLIAFLLGLHYSVNSIQKKENDVSQSISTYNDTIAKIYLLNTRLSDISTILKGRSGAQDSVGKIIDDASSVNIESYSTNEAGEVNITVSSISLLNLNDYLNKIIGLASSNGNVKMQDLRIDTNGYTMTLVVNLI